MVNGVVAQKPHQPVGPDDAIAIDDPAGGYVSRAALKLIAGLDAAGISVAETVCLDIGASTGGFTQVLLDRGAAKVYAVDVGHRQLHETIRADARVVSIEGTNARDLSHTLIPHPIDLLVCDVSFVSATKVLAAPLALCRPDATAVILIKPQFEVGPDRIGKGGIVTDDVAIGDAVAGTLHFMSAAGWRHVMSVPSPIAGGDGNRETVAMFRRTVSTGR